ncbi:acetylserotonin O-methyltransferase-like [Benincasa hispida]|uniref:acetylserotonin O-methyltransferase-like n=1 Tax=Benincasa hispida TaxID=102211 RepID=UPI0018FFF654|nr:acetylserotonin O-methyltransferase-like [Benincasa hispida]
MEETITKESKWKKEEEEAKIQIYKYVFGFAEAAAIKCAIELKIADAIESHGRPMTLSQLSTALNCSPPLLFRIMRFLVHRRIFKEETTAENVIGYSQTPLSHLLITVAPLLVLENSPTIVESWHNLSARLKNNDSTSDLLAPFEVAHGKGIWSYAATNPEFNRMFNEGLGCNARVITLPTILESCGDIFNGIGSLVDVGGGNGTTLSILVKAFPWMKGINFDLPNVVSTSEEYNGVEHVAGNMLHFVPNADAAFFMWILHAWDDEDCIKILKNCKEAIPEDRGKVIIIDSVIDEKEENKMLSDIRLTLDIMMMTRSRKGRERTHDEWTHLLINKAGFSRCIITPIPHAVPSIIQAFMS